MCDATVALMAQLAAEAVSPAVDARVLATQLQVCAQQPCVWQQQCM